MPSPNSDQQTRILIVDDDDASRFLVRKVLEGLGHSILEAPNLKSGLAMAEKNAPHLILLDLVMPGGSGFEFLEARRKSAPLRAVPVMVMSGLRDADAIYKAVSLAADDYLTKPIDIRVLKQKVLKALQNVHYPKRVFKPGERPAVTVRFNGRITLSNEVGFLLEVPVKIAEKTQLQIDSPFLDELEAQTAVLRRTDRPAKYHTDSHYLNEVAVVGLSPSSVAIIKKLLKANK